MSVIGRVIARLFAAFIVAGAFSVAGFAQELPTPDAATATASLLPENLSPWGMFLSAHIVVKAVMVGLVLASVITWTVALAKGWELFSGKRLVRRQNLFLSRAASLEEAGHAVAGQAQLEAAAQAALQEMELSRDIRDKTSIKERIASRLERTEAALGRHMTRGAGVLATIGAISPFVGLFGTVWGIMNSFIGISRQHTTNLAVVAPGIAEALLATALGLVAAIPAVIIYNLFSRGLASYRALCADGSAEILRLASRDLDRAEFARPSQRRVNEAAE